MCKILAYFEIGLNSIYLLSNFTSYLKVFWFCNTLFKD